MFSQKSRYALRAMMILAELPSAEVMMAAEIARRAAVPRRFLEQILAALKASGLVHATRGRAGGYALAAPADDIDFASILLCIDGSFAPAPCAEFTAHRRCANCPDSETCDIRRTLIEVRDSTAHILARRTLADALAARREQ